MPPLGMVIGVLIIAFALALAFMRYKSLQDQVQSPSRSHSKAAAELAAALAQANAELNETPAQTHARKRQELERYIDPQVQGGEPVIRGTRLTVTAISTRINNGDSIDDLERDYPYIDPAALVAAVEYGQTLN